MNDDETLDLGHLLADHYAQINTQMGGIEPIRTNLSPTEDLPGFIEKLVQKIVFGPLQEAFTGEEIKSAINQSKAISLASGFMDLSEKTLAMIFLRNANVDDRNFKDYRDFFAISVLSYLLKFGPTESSLAPFLPNCKIADFRHEVMWKVLGEYYINEMRDSTSGIMSLAMLLSSTCATDDDKFELSSPVQFDTLFTSS